MSQRVISVDDDELMLGKRAASDDTIVDPDDRRVAFEPYIVVNVFFCRCALRAAPSSSAN